MSNKEMQKPDDYFKMGPFEVVRFGNVVSMKNNMTLEQADKFTSILADCYEDEKAKIDNDIKKFVN